jgi:hypothetical protein
MQDMMSHYKTKISHLHGIDYLKVTSKTGEEIWKFVQRSKSLSRDIHAKFEHYKFRKTVLTKRKLVESQSLIFDVKREIQLELEKI